ncbi:hypothetical protein Asi02nite_45510 [Asanoa siamensis]|uniref:Exo-alpha-sialidase n=1 Tax=Asanoa siamensis TaxID=926357 RepID=A0ABQ4CUV1_9ACTN|nr:hypothetical protein Asi02nite_45510 [Asanoa siamensis]
MVCVLAVGAVAVRAHDGGAPARWTDQRTEQVGPWRVAREAFAVDDRRTGGPRVLLPNSAGCFTGFGAGGLSGGYWFASGACTTIGVVEPAGAGDDAVLAVGSEYEGAYLAVTGHHVLGNRHGTPEDWRQVAGIAPGAGPGPGDGGGPVPLTIAGPGYVAVGQRDGRAVAWLSTDGKSWRTVVLPPPPGATETHVTAVAEAPAAPLVAIGTSTGPNATSQVTAWVSTDDGRSWRPHPVPGLDGAPQVRVLLNDGRRFFALGGTSGDVRAPALVLTSTDGRTWQRDDTAATAGVRMIRAATSLPGGEMLAVAGSGEGRNTGDNRECASAWLVTRPSGEWTREDLGCAGVPTVVAGLASGPIVAVHGTTLFLRQPHLAPPPEQSVW